MDNICIFDKRTTIQKEENTFNKLEQGANINKKKLNTYMQKVQLLNSKIPIEKYSLEKTGLRINLVKQTQNFNEFSIMISKIMNTNLNYINRVSCQNRRSVGWSFCTQGLRSVHWSPCLVELTHRWVTRKLKGLNLLHHKKKLAELFFFNLKQKSCRNAQKAVFVFKSGTGQHIKSTMQRSYRRSDVHLA